MKYFIRTLVLPFSIHQIYFLHRKIFILFLIVCSTLITNKSQAQKQGQERIDSLLTVLPNANEDTNKIKILINLSREYNTVNPNDGVKFGEQALSLAKKLDSKKLIAHSSLCIGMNYNELAEYDSAVYYYSEALKYYKKLNDRLNIAASYCGIGLIYDAQSDYPKALNYLEDALKIFEEEKEETAAAQQMGNIGIVYDEMSDYSMALEYYFKGLKIYEKLDNKRGQAVVLSNIGTVYHELSDYSKALEYCFKSLKIFEKLGAKPRVATVLNDIGANYGQLNEYSKASENFFKALQIQEEVGNKTGIASALGNIGDNYLAQSDYENAIQYYLKSLKVDTQIGDKSGIALNQGNIGISYFKIASDSNHSIINKLFEGNKKQALQEAKSNLSNAIDVQNEIGNLDNQFKNYYYLSLIHEELGDNKGALESFKNYSSLKDSVFNSEKNKKLTQIAMQYDFDKKQAVTKAESDAEIQRQKTFSNNLSVISGIILIGILISIWFYKRKRDAEQEAKETAAKLRISETELKALRLQINPHFINNAMQSIQSFMRNHKPEEAEEYLIMFSNLTRAILENSEKEEISLRRELEILEWYIKLENIRMTFPFTYKFNIDNNIDVDSTNVPPNILQPFVENSIMHGLTPKQSSGNINIYIDKKDGDLHVMIEDDGVGREANKRVQQPMLLKKESMGMKITQDRLNIINSKNNSKASFKISDLILNNPSSGTRVELNLPLQA